MAIQGIVRSSPAYLCGQQSRRSKNKELIFNLFFSLVFSKKEELLKRECLLHKCIKIINLRREEKALLKGFYKVPSDNKLIEDYLFKALTTSFGTLSCNVSKKIAEKILKNTLSVKLCSNIFKWYHLEEANELTPDEMKAIVIGIKANLTLKDLQKLMSDKVINACFLKNSALDTPKKVAKVVIGIREVKIDFEINSLNIAKISYNQLKKDIEFLMAAKRYKLYHPYPGDPDKKISFLQEEAENEYLSRDLVYGLYSFGKTNFQNGVLTPSYTWNKKKWKNCLTCYKASSLLTKNGIHAAFLTPLFPGSSTPLKATVVFRGTYGAISLLRGVSLNEKTTLIHLEGIGYKSFMQHFEELKMQILSNFAKLSKKSGQKNFEVTFTGHSLGGADASMLASKVVEEEALYHRISKLNLVTWNATALSHAIALKFIEEASKLKGKSIDIRHHQVEGDPFQQVGSTFLGYTESEIPEHIRVSLIRYLHKELTSYGDLYLKHSKRCLTEMGDEGEREKNDTEVALYVTNQLSQPFQSENGDKLRAYLLTALSYRMGHFF